MGEYATLERKGETVHDQSRETADFQNSIKKLKFKLNCYFYIEN